ncbi:hypothetical protein C9J85_05770 [Haloferax sp. wsp5]|nr:hypothetical protein C9J85_05770 [Haloferax sp. wsp5]
MRILLQQRVVFGAVEQIVAVFERCCYDLIAEDRTVSFQPLLKNIECVRHRVLATQQPNQLTNV